MIQELDRLGVSYLLSRDALREDFRRSGRNSKNYYFQRGVRGQNHYTPLGNEVVFRELYTWISESSR